MKIDLFVDLTCPFCYVSKLILDDLKNEYNLEINYHVIRINKDVVEKELVVERYPQSVSIIPKLNNMIKDYKKKMNYKYKVNSLNPTMLYYNIYNKNKENAYKLLSKLNEDYFTQNIDISDSEYINERAKKYNIEFVDMEMTHQLYVTEKLASQLGVSGTPFMVIDNQYTISGVRDKDDMIRTFDKLNSKS